MNEGPLISLKHLSASTQSQTEWIGLRSLDSPGETRNLLLLTDSPPTRAQPLFHKPCHKKAQILTLANALEKTPCYKNTSLNSQGSSCSFIVPHHYLHIFLMESGTKQLNLLQRNSKIPENLKWGYLYESSPDVDQSSPSPGEIQSHTTILLSSGGCKLPLRFYLHIQRPPEQIFFTFVT